MNSLSIVGHRISQLAQNLQRRKPKSQIIWPRRYAKVVAGPRLETSSPDSQGRALADPFSDPVADNQIMTKLSFSKLTPEEFYSGWQPFWPTRFLTWLLYLLSHIKFYHTSKYSLLWAANSGHLTGLFFFLERALAIPREMNLNDWPRDLVFSFILCIMTLVCSLM